MLNIDENWTFRPVLYVWSLSLVALRVFAHQFILFIFLFQDGFRDRDRRSPTYYDESETEESFRIFVALFDYDPLSMSPNPDAADEELPFKEGQIIRVSVYN